MVKLVIGSDHAGFELKEQLKKFLAELGYEYDDLGAYSPEPCDYPEIAYAVAKKAAKAGSKGILVCGTGIGEAIVANKVRGVRAANCFNEYTAKMSREHNDANVLCLGARILNGEEAKKVLAVWLETDFSNEERHIRRVSQIKGIESRKGR